MKNYVKVILKTYFFKMFFAFINLFYRYHYIIYSDCMLRHACAICTEAATGGVL